MKQELKPSQKEFQQFTPCANCSCDKKKDCCKKYKKHGIHCKKCPKL